MTTSPETSDAILEQIRAKRRNLASYVTITEPRGVRLNNLSIICGSIATVLTAGPAIGGQTLTDALGGPGSSWSWRLLCAGAAVSSLIATVATNIYKSREISSRLAKANACDAKLEILEIGIDLRKITDDEALSRYSECISILDFPIPEAEEGSRRAARVDSVKGGITEPAAEAGVGKSFPCSGWSQGLERGLHLWLAVELPGKIWPKAGEIHVADDGSWNKTVFEDGDTEHFSLSLYAANAEGDSHIRAWFKRCDRTGIYTELKGMPGTIRVDRVDGLSRTHGTKA